SPLRISVGGWTDKLLPGGQIELPWTVLGAARETGSLLGNPSAEGGALRIPALGSTLLFADTDLGLMHTATPAHKPVRALTREPDLHRRLAAHVAPAQHALPAGWRLLRDIPVSAVVGTEAVDAVEAVETRPELSIEGGLAVDHRVFLTREPPFLVASDAA